MQRGICGFILIAAGLGVGAALQGRVTAQASQAAQGQDVLPALLVEVRGLRAAMEQMASSGPRVQLALGRLQLQEQRVNNLLRRLEAARASLAGAQRDEEQFRQILGQLEETSKTGLDPVQRGQAEQELAMVKQRNAGAAAEVQRLQVEESGHRAGARLRAGTVVRHQSTDGGARTGADEEVSAAVSPVLR